MGKYLSSTSTAELQQEGPRIRISISAPEEEIEIGRAFAIEYPEPLSVSALIDTGASLTVINPEIVQSCRLSQTGFTKISSAGNMGDFPTFAAHIEFPSHNLRGFEIIPVVACSLPQQSISCLIGRDILRRWMFTYNGRTGEFVVTD
jgi:predicted aspartyl protease